MNRYIGPLKSSIWLTHTIVTTLPFEDMDKQYSNAAQLAYGAPLFECVKTSNFIDQFDSFHVTYKWLIEWEM